MDPLGDIIRRAQTRPARIVLSEGADPRIAAAAVSATALGIADVTLVGPDAQVRTALGDAGGGAGIATHDPETSDRNAEFADAFHQARKHKGVTPDQAARFVREPLVFAAMMVHLDQADGTVGGAVNTTPDVVRAALQVIGKAPDAALVSSFFLMILRDPAGKPVIFADCGLVVEPDATDLAGIAAASAASFQTLIGEPPKVAILSFSTMGSARHPMVAKMREATELTRAAVPGLAVDGELQFDAAFVPAIGTSKAPGSDVAGQANVFIFPNLDAGNLGYKIAQRIGGATAIGPVLQGLARPANDLSRGCTAEDVVAMIAVTVVQAQA